jgi:hypothetical protein
MADQFTQDVAAAVLLYRATANDCPKVSRAFRNDPRRSAIAWIRSLRSAIRRGGLVLRLAIALASVAIAFWVSADLSPDPAKTGFSHLPTMPFYPAVLCAGLLAGSGAGWFVVISALVLQAQWLPPPNSVLISQVFTTFFLEFAVTMSILSTGTTVFDRMAGHWSARREPQPANQQFEDSQRGLVINDPHAGAVTL